jgi:phosphatidylglycerophosphate synthase
VQQRRFLQAYQSLRVAQKSKRSGTPVYTQEVNRRLGRVIAALCVDTRITPNQLSVFNLLMTLVALATLLTVLPSLSVSILVACVLLFAYATDSADGQLARLRAQQSPRGEWLDHVIDCGKQAIIHWAVFFYLLRFSDYDLVAIAIPVFFFQVFSLLLYFSGILKSKLCNQKDLTPETDYQAWISWALLVLDYGFLCAMFVFAYDPSVFYVLYSVLAFTFTVVASIFLIRTFKHLPASAS